MSAYHVCVVPQCVWRSEDGVGSSAAGVMDGCEPPTLWMLGIELSPLPEQVSLTAETSLQAYTNLFLKTHIHRQCSQEPQLRV